MPHSFPPYGVNDSRKLNIILMLENYAIFTKDFEDRDYLQQSNEAVLNMMNSDNTLTPNEARFFADSKEDAADWIEFYSTQDYDAEKVKQKLDMRRIRSEKEIWENKIMRNFFTSTNKPLCLPPGHILIRQDTARRCRKRLTDRWITKTKPGDFSSTEDVVRWLGYGRVYDNLDECLFTGLKLDSTDIDSERDIIETRIRIPLLDTSDTPLIRVHRSVTKRGAWRTTREGCSIAAPHVSMGRYHDDFEKEISGTADWRTQVCHVTGMDFQRSPNWLEGVEFFSGHWLIPVSMAIIWQFNDWLIRNGTPDGLLAEEWSTKWLQPRIAMKPLD